MKHDHSRVSPEGQRIGEQLVDLATPAIEYGLSCGERDERCDTCAFRPGTVPNGCLQTQMDALKAVREGVPFMCHQDPQHRVYCYGWLAARAALRNSGAPLHVEAPWAFTIVNTRTKD